MESAISKQILGIFLSSQTSGIFVLSSGSYYNPISVVKIMLIMM